MNEQSTRSWVALACLALASSASAQTAVRFDTVDTKAKAPVSLFGAVREATKDMELPAVKATKDVQPAVQAAAKAVEKPQAAQASKEELTFWGRDGRWCPDGQVYRGGPCDYGDPYYRDPYPRGPYRDPYDDPNWYRRDPYRRDPYWRDPYRDPHRRYPGRGPTRDPWRDPPTRRRGRW